MYCGEKALKRSIVDPSVPTLQLMHWYTGVVPLGCILPTKFILPLPPSHRKRYHLGWYTRSVRQSVNYPYELGVIELKDMFPGHCSCYD